MKVQIAGHTDSIGDASANQDLSERRAKTVKQTLTERYGADANRLTAKGYGAEQPRLPMIPSRGVPSIAAWSW